jgi:hypothetical protein
MRHQHIKKQRTPTRVCIPPLPSLMGAREGTTPRTRRAASARRPCCVQYFEVKLVGNNDACTTLCRNACTCRSTPCRRKIVQKMPNACAVHATARPALYDVQCRAVYRRGALDKERDDTVLKRVGRMEVLRASVVSEIWQRGKGGLFVQYTPRV